MAVKPQPLLDRLFSHVDATGPCWLWAGAKNRGGYGIFNIGRHSGTKSAHRLVWTLLVGPVPDGMDLDHLCRVRACCNPDHLQPVTRAENVARGTHRAGIRRGFRCGHPATSENTAITGPRGNRTCRTCKNATSRRYRSRKAAA